MNELETLKKAIKEQRDPREQAYKEIVTNLFDEKKLMMVTRLSEEYGHMIVRNFILIDFYQNWFNETKVVIRFERIEKPPFFVGIPHYEIKDEERKNAYKNLIDNVMKVKISERGKGREEAIKILRASDDEMERKKSMKNMFGNFMPPSR